MQKNNLSQDTEVSDSISLMISILLCYPQIGTVKLDPEQKVFRFTFILSEVVSTEQTKSFQKEYLDCLEAFLWLIKIKESLIEIDFKYHENFTLVEFKRDMESLSQDEIALMVSIIGGHFTDSLIIEDNDAMIEEDLLVQEELIGHMLENLKDRASEKPLIAYREEGRVLVFDK